MIEMENYSVCAFKKYETVAGVIEEEPMKPVNVRTTAEAEKIAKEMAATGKYNSIYIAWSKGDNSGHWNPVVGFEVAGKDWITYLGN
jgi:hypothetical protein